LDTDHLSYLDWPMNNIKELENNKS
jgi:hypothetical protein